LAPEILAKPHKIKKINQIGANWIQYRRAKNFARWTKILEKSLSENHPSMVGGVGVSKTPLWEKCQIASPCGKTARMAQPGPSVRQSAEQRRQRKQAAHRIISGEITITRYTSNLQQK